MTKTIEQIQKENRKLILEAIHNCCYEEALKKELGFGCQILVQHYVCGVKDKTEILTIDKSVGVCDITGLYVFTGDNKKPSEIIEIIGKPITLNRVLNAIDPFGNYGCIARHICKVNRKQATYAFICEWNLELEALEQQSEETQRGINQLLTGE